MNKQLAALALWFLVGWTAGGLLASAIGLNPVVGPVVGVALTVSVLLAHRAPAAHRH